MRPEEEELHPEFLEASEAFGAALQRFCDLVTELQEAIERRISEDLSE